MASDNKEENKMCSDDNNEENKNNVISFVEIGALQENNKMERENNGRTPINFLSSTSLDREVTDIYNIPENSTHLSVTGVLNYCKSKILNPYLRLLSITGLRPLLSDHQEPSILFDILSYFYTFQVITFMVIGYFLQYMACFRRDRGFCYNIANNFLLKSEVNEIYEQICHASILFSFVIPSCLHLAAYVHAVFVLRGSDDDHLPTLMERVFLSSTNLSDGFASQKKLVKCLWLFVVFSIIWMLLSLALVNYMMAKGDINFKWLEESPPWLLLLLKILLVISTLWHDIVQATVISNYCLQAQLLTSYLHFLREKILQSPIPPIEWMRDIEEFKKMLNYFNKKIAPSVCIFTTINVSCAISGVLWLFNFDHVDKETLPIMGLSVLNVLLWVLISVAPFIQASRLSTACEVLKAVGQEVRIRPFVHQDTPSYELDSVLMYTSSLKIKATLFHLPITGKYLCFCITMLSILILVLGQCHYLNSI